ncbi:hypothetical protein ACFL6U_28275 [Planctomycetota bacterium]
MKPVVRLLMVIITALPSVLFAQKGVIKNWQYNPDKELNPNTQWLREAKWGLFVHYYGSRNRDAWNAQVNSFKVKEFAEQLSELKVPYFFITLGTTRNFCAPNENYEKLFGGALTDRDLIADLAAELIPRGIKLGIYMHAVGRGQGAEVQQKWQKVIREWSERYGDKVSGWWIDVGKYESPEAFKAFTAAFKSGNPKAIVTYNSAPVGWNRDQLLPATEHEDYLAGECDFILPTCGVRVFDGKEYYQGPNISGDQLHFLTYMGTWWGGDAQGQPRFSDDLVISWTQHINDHAGAVTWDVPLTKDGLIPESYFKQIKALSNAINKAK